MGNRNILAYPDAPATVRKQAVKRYRATTFRRFLVRQSAISAVACHLDKVFFAKEELFSDTCPLINFDDWLDYVNRDILMDPTLYPVILWPPHDDRGRIYVHFVSPRGEPRAFAKFSLDDTNNRELAAESGMLASFQANCPRTFHVPDLLENGEFESKRFMIVGAIPDSAKTAPSRFEWFPRDVIDELRSMVPMRICAGSSVEALPWWNRFRGLGESYWPFAAYLSSLPERLFRLTRVHGDFGPANIMTDGKKLWIVDWEQSTDLGPWLADEISFYLALNRKRILRSPFAARRAFACRYLGSDETGNGCDPLMALAFLAGAGLDTAQRLVQGWDCI